MKIEFLNDKYVILFFIYCVENDFIFKSTSSSALWTFSCSPLFKLDRCKNTNRHSVPKRARYCNYLLSLHIINECLTNNNICFLCEHSHWLRISPPFKYIINTNTTATTYPTLFSTGPDVCFTKIHLSIS